MADDNYAVDVGLPFRFTEDCDILLDVDDAIIQQALDLITFTPAASLLLFPEMGSEITTSVFDPLDPVSNILIDNSIRKAMQKLEPRIVLDKKFIFTDDPDNNKKSVLVPGRVVPTNRPATLKLDVTNNS